MTFLITDVEGSTRAFQRLGPEYPALLAEHHQLVHEAIDRHNGFVVKDAGDGLLVAFGDARAACAAAVEAQIALSGGPWPVGARLRVRMGLHSGEATAVEGDYVSLALHQAARIAAAGHGDQILASEATVALAREALPADTTVREIGAHWLRDFDAPAPLFQLCHPSLPGTFPRLRVPTASSPGLPVGRTSFVGRERELATLRELLGSAPMVTVIALGGTGKTRLATRVAGEVEEAYPDGVWLVDLGALQAGASVASAVATTLGLVETPGQPIDETLLSHLRTRCTMLVLDAAEHVRDEARGLVHAVIAACPGVTVLLTSRVPLGVTGEVVWHLPPMAVPQGSGDAGAVLNTDSARLFVERAATVRVGFAATTASAPSIARICRRLGGIPLAIELAAARLKVLTPEKLADRLEASLAVLDTTPEDGDNQLRTLTATIDWSWRLLAHDEQMLFRRLSVFANGAGLEAIEDVCAGGDLAAAAVLDVLARLLDKSLIVYSEPLGEPRYRMLDAVREYASARLRESGETESTTKRFVRWCEEFTQGLAAADEQPDYKQWLERADLEIDNLRAALTIAEAADDSEALSGISARISAYLPFRGRFEESRRWLAVAVESQRRRGERTASLWCRSAILEQVVGETAAAEALYREVLDNTGDTDTWRPSALFGLCSIAIANGDMVAAKAFAEAGLEHSRRLSNRVDEINALGHLGGIDWMSGELDAARQRFQMLWEICVDSGDHRRATNALLNLVGVVMDQGHNHEGLELAIKLVAACRDFSEPDTFATALQYLGTLHLRLGQMSEALPALAEGLAMFREVGLPHYVAIGLAPYARGRSAAGDRDAALAACTEGLRLCETMSDFAPVADLLRALADLWADIDGAIALDLLRGSVDADRRMGIVPSPAAEADMDSIAERARQHLPTPSPNHGSGSASAQPRDLIARALALPAPPTPP